MNILEKDLEDVMYDLIKNNAMKLEERGFCVEFNDHVERQFNLGSYGIADICAFSYSPNCNELLIKIIELKKDVVDMNTYMQALKYKRGFEHYFGDKYDLVFYINLVGKNICQKNDFPLCISSLENTYVYTYSLDIDLGIKFQFHEGFSKQTPNFNYNKIGFDKIDECIEACKVTYK